MKELKFEAIKSQTIKVIYTDEFMDNLDERLDSFSKYFCNVESLEEYTKELLSRVAKSDYTTSPSMIEGFGSPWMRSWYDDKILFEPKNGKWEAVADGRLPECGIILKQEEVRSNALSYSDCESEIDDLVYLLEE